MTLLPFLKINFSQLRSHFNPLLSLTSTILLCYPQYMNKWLSPFTKQEYLVLPKLKAKCSGQIKCSNLYNKKEHCEKRRKCWLPASCPFSSFSFQESSPSWSNKKLVLSGKGLTVFGWFFGPFPQNDTF